MITKIDNVTKYQTNIYGMALPQPSLGIGDILKRGSDKLFDRIRITSVDWVDANQANFSDAQSGKASVLQITIRNKSDTLIENVGGYIELKGKVENLTDLHSHDRADLNHLERRLPFAETGKLKMDFSPRDMAKLNVLAVRQTKEPHESDSNNYPINHRFEVTIPKSGLDNLGYTMDDEFIRKRDIGGYEIKPARPGIGPSVNELYNMEFDIASVQVTGSRVSSDEKTLDMNETLSTYQEY